ncbi:helix-turn-helix domain-containing protein [Leptobacterium flavescens]|uniref:Helix-turn-helix domain-containing protein n=1 Tax=Leptobacterium flavescens TaxID=472055 RepID=A0A6P0UIA5_9FLAO|nr:AraC family transcriptional regulator [Leptobacterium flavescens]NER12727.1 helix-turn-helix domain-containing protein [Leptobacterium flavescens]
MIFLKKLIFIIVFVFSNHSFYGQEIQDSLLNKNYKELREGYWEAFPDSIKCAKYANTYLYKAKKARDTIKIARGYQWFNMLTNDYVEKKYADSIILITKNIKDHPVYPAIAFHSRGVFLYNTGSYEAALNDFLIAREYAENNNNLYLFFSIRGAIAALKSKMGKDQEALDIHKQELKDVGRWKVSDIEKASEIDENTDYIGTLLNISLSYIKLSKLDSADIFLKRGIKESLKLNDTLSYYSFVSSSGYNEYFKGNYRAASDSLDKAFPFDDDQNARINYYLYKGKIARDLNNVEEAISHFEKLDSIYEVYKDPVRELPEVYKTFINYYKEKGDTENQLKYLDKLIAADSVLDANFYYLNTNITKEYDIPQLTAEKDKLIRSLQRKKTRSKNGIIILSFLFLLFGGLFFYYYRKQRMYKKKFGYLMQESRKEAKSFQLTETKIKVEDEGIKGISEELIKKIIGGLNAFEQKNEFLDPSITLNSLSKKLHTNSNYLSKVINYYEQKNFSNYINGLRIDYTVEQFKANKQFRLYSVKGIAEEVGFKSTESFSKAFFKRTGIYPSYFIKQLMKG